MRAHRVRDPPQQHDRDVALAAFKLGNVAFGNAGDLGEHLSRHAAKRAHGPNTLAELFEKAGFAISGHGPRLKSARPKLFWAKWMVQKTPRRKHNTDEDCQQARSMALYAL